MTVLHLWHSSGWRGGENQFRLLATHLPEPWRGVLGAPAGSELARRMADAMPIRPLRCGGFLDLPSVLAARRLVRSQGLRLVHAHDSHGLATALALKALAGLPVIASRRNAFPISSRWKYRASDLHIAVSAAASSQLLLAGVPSGRVDIVPDAVDLSALDAARPERLGAGEDDPVVLCVAAFSAEKNHRLLLDAWSAVERAAPKARLCLAGEGPMENDLRLRANGLGLRNVHFPGWREDVPALIKGADLVVLTSDIEGLGSSLCEAQAAGKAVAATAAGGIVEAVEDGRTGLLSPPGDTEAFARNILALLDDPARRRDMGVAGALRARELFAPEAVAARHAELYASVLPR